MDVIAERTPASYRRGSPAHDAFLTGKRLMVERAWRRAALAFLKAVRLQPEVRASWDLAAQALSNLRRHGFEVRVRAHAAMRFGTQGPDAAAGAHRLANLAFRFGDPIAAARWLRQAFMGDPANARYTREFAWLLQRADPTLPAVGVAGLLGAIRPLSDLDVAVIDHAASARRALLDHVRAEALASPSAIPSLPRRPRVAVLVSGQLRDPMERLPILRTRLAAPIRADVFVHSWATVGLPRLNRLFAADLQAALQRVGLPVDDTLQHRFPVISAIQGVQRPTEAGVARAAGAIRCVLEEEPESLARARAIDGVVFPEAWRTYSVGSLPMFYKIRKCFDLMEAHERETGQPYDIVVRVRPDMNFQDRVATTLPIDVARPGTVFVSGVELGHVDDQFAIGTREAMARYCRVFDRLPDYWMGRGAVPGATRTLGEQLLFQHLYYEGLAIERLAWTRRPALMERSIGLAEFRTLLQAATKTPALAPSAREMLAALEAA